MLSLGITILLPVASLA